MKEKKSSKLDVSIALVALVGLALFIYLLFESIQGVAPLRSPQAKVVGDVFVPSSGVRVKTSEDYSWYPLRDRSEAFLGDTIFNSGTGKATLRLKPSGSEIKLEPFSMITISEVEGVPEVVLHFGEFESTVGEGGLAVSADGDRSVFGPTEARIRLKREAQRVNIESVGGDLEVRRGGQTIKIPEDQRLTLMHSPLEGDGQTGDSSPQVAFTLEMTPTSPPKVKTQSSVYQLPPVDNLGFEQGFYRVPKGRGMELSWAPEEGVSAAEYELVVSRDLEFSQGVQSIQVSSPQVQIHAIPQNKVYWKVRSREVADGPWSEFSKVGQVQVDVPALKKEPSPPRFLVKGEDRADALVEWEPFLGVDNFEVEHRLDGESEWRRTLLSSPRLRISGKKSEGFSWRVRAVDGFASPLGSFSPEYRVAFGEDIFPPVPVPQVDPLAGLSPEQRARLELKAQALAKPPSLRGPAQQETFITFGESPTFMVFDWRAHSGVEKYEIQISSELNFSTVIMQATVDKAQYVFTGLLKEGQYYWRVRSVMDEETSPWSAPKSVRIAGR